MGFHRDGLTFSIVQAKCVNALSGPMRNNVGQVLTVSRPAEAPDDWTTGFRMEGGTDLLGSSTVRADDENSVR